MITIDGSYGEGGGQIIRTAVGLAAVTGTGVEIHNIRKHRSQTGLKAQHLAAVKTAATMTHAEVAGLNPGSTRLTFKPEGIFGVSLFGRYWYSWQYSPAAAVSDACCVSIPGSS